MSIIRRFIVTGRKGCDLYISRDAEAEGAESYISIGPDGTNVSIRCDGIVYYFNSFKDMVKSINPNFASIISVDDDKIRYFELELSRGTLKNYHPEGRTFCMKGIRKPTLEEATEFSKKALIAFDCDLVTSIKEISRDEAYEKYFIRDKKKIFGLN